MLVCAILMNTASGTAYRRKVLVQLLYTGILENSEHILHTMLYNFKLITSLVNRLVASCIALGGTVLTSVRDSKGVEVTYNIIFTHMQ